MRAIAVVVLALLAFCASAQEVYKWTDAQGVVHFSDRKPADKTAQAMQLESAPLSSAAVETPPQTDPKTTAVRKTPLNITMYSTVDCGYCQRARRYFAESNIGYTERDISHPENHAQWKRLGGQGVPLFVINGTVSSGFSAAGMTQHLQQLGW